MTTRRHVDARHGATLHPIVKLGNGHFAILLAILFLLLALISIGVWPLHAAGF